MLGFLHSKVGVVTMAVLVCAMFFGLSRLKARNRERQNAADGAVELQAALPTRQAQDLALLKRAQETARGRGQDARAERTMGRKTQTSYDESGNTLERRETPEPLSPHVFSDDREWGGDRSPTLALPVLVPGLRIRGRAPVRSANEQRSGASAASEPLGSPPFTTREGREPGRVGASTVGETARSTPPVEHPLRFVPFGRLIKAELVITLESTHEEMPLIGLVVEPVYNNGRLVIPAGTELHSMARPDRIRDRLLSVTTWRMVFPREGHRLNGRQLTFDGIALDRADGDGNGLTWDLRDGSYGLRGRVVRNGTTAEELKLFAAEALKAAGASLMDRQPTTYGIQMDVNAKNAALAGGQAVLENFAERIAQELERNGVYIQVPAGKQFYVYPQQVIDPDRAGIPENIAKVE